ncbi:MAG: tripartite tricarboxylate transporter permease [Clostridia bacterium]
MELFIEVLGSLCTLKNILFINIGLACGITVGSLPGLTAVMAVALLLPLTFGLEPITGMLLLLGVYCGGTYGGSITAILINTPGTPSAAATVLDGYKMAQKGRAGEALQMALVASVFGGLFSAVALMFTAPALAAIALKFGPAEYFALAVFGLTIISGVSGKSIVKAIIMGLLGLLVSTVGLDPMDGFDRFTFGITPLAGGIQLIPALVGIFAISEIFTKIKDIEKPIDEAAKFTNINLPFSEILRCGKTIVKSSIIGSIIGAIPGTGAAIASFFSYNEAKRSSKSPELFGTGILEGIAAPEAANNAVTGGALIPLLTLGIPGDVVTAIMLGALMMQGITPGPSLFVNQKHWVYAIMLGIIFINIFMYLQGRLFIKAFVNVTKIPVKLLTPILVFLCILGSYAVNNTTFDCMIMVIFGVVGYLLLKLDFPLTPMVIAIVLGPLAEVNMRRALILSEGSPIIFFQKPISAVILTLSALMIIMPFVSKFINKSKKGDCDGEIIERK